MLCILCKKNKVTIHPKICDECIIGIRASFSFGIGGQEVSYKNYQTIIKAGKIIPELLDKERQ